MIPPRENGKGEVFEPLAVGSAGGSIGMGTRRKRRLKK